MSKAGRPLLLSGDERAFLTETRAIQIDSSGVEVFVGLNRAESEEYLALVSSEGRSKDRSEREDELYAWHEPLRCQIVAAEAEARQAGAKH